MKNIWELPRVIQDETRMMDPVTWHARKPEGKILPLTPLISLPPSDSSRWENWLYLREDMLLYERGQCPQLLLNLSALLVPMNQQSLKFL